MPIRLADQSTIISEHSVTLPIRFTPYHVKDIVFRIVPTLTHGMLLGMEWFSLFTPVVDWTARVVTLTIDGESLELKCVTPKRPPITISTAEQFEQMLSNPKCKRKAFAVYIEPLEGVDESAHLQAVTGHPVLPDMESHLPDKPTNGTKPTSSNHAKPVGENAGQASRWDRLCSEYSDLFTTPGFPVDRKIKHRIDLLNPNLPVKHHRQYRMSPTELEEVRS